MRIRFKGIAFKLFMICFVCALSGVILIGELSYRYIRHQVHANNEYYIEQMMYKVDQYLSLTFTSLQTIIFAVETSGLSTNTIQQLTKLYELNMEYVKNVYIIKPDLSILSGRMLNRVFDEPLPERAVIYNNALTNPVTTLVNGPYSSTYSGWTVTITRLLPGSNPPLVIALDLDLQSSENTLLELNKKELLNLALLDNDGKIVAGFPESKGKLQVDEHTFSVSNLTGKRIMEITDPKLTVGSGSDEVNISKLSASDFNWTIVSINDYSRIQESLTRLQEYYFSVLGIGIVISLVSALLITRFIRKPLGYLTHKMNAVKKGNLNVVVSYKKEDEFGELAQSFDDMLKRIMELMNQLDVNKENQRRLEIQMLQSQMNPHFLYNTLGSISNVVKLGKLDNVDPVIQSLISIMEYGLSDASLQVPLMEELNNVRDYIRIQSIRYNKEFPIIEEVEEGLHTYLTFRMLLQPLVENCLFHGYNGGRVAGTIYIRAYRLDDKVCIEVADRGIGMTDEIRDVVLSGQMPSRTSGDNIRGRQRIGMRNIHERIRLYYGEPYGLTIGSEPGNGTSVKIQLPGTSIEGEWA
ncbi:sensor histidine kinase [Paenibacillus sp. FSL H7-0714]|uniref:sensor histidine kinase n=1 Tax=Paenibacillus sp. FSL H7-0714 TaxID=2954735 RepID=UPI0030F98C70